MTTNGTPTNLSPEILTINALTQQLLSTRLQLAQLMGVTHEGQRDTWKIFGYPDQIEPARYWAWYERGAMAQTIVDLPPQDTWKLGAVLLDGEARSDDGQPASAFLQAWQELVDEQELWRHFLAVDTLSRIGRFGVMLIGATSPGQASALSEPLESVNGIAYLSVYGEPEVELRADSLVDDPADPRFGKPRQYHINLGLGKGHVPVHYSRIIHVAEGRLRDDIYGRPALRAVYNRLLDKEKIVGGGAEAFWLLVNRGLAIIADEGFPTNDTAALAAFQDEVDNYKHGLDRIMRLGGVKLQELSPEVVDPSGHYDMILSEISAATGIPRRKLIGTEEGRLAGAQDERGWINNINARRQNHAEPVILRPFVDWCIGRGILPEPGAGEYGVEWPNLFERDEKAEAEVAEIRARAVATYGGGQVRPDLIYPLEDFQMALGIAPTNAGLPPQQAEPA